MNLLDPATGKPYAHNVTNDQAADVKKLRDNLRMAKAHAKDLHERLDALGSLTYTTAHILRFCAVHLPAEMGDETAAMLQMTENMLCFCGAENDLNDAQKTLEIMAHTVEVHKELERAVEKHAPTTH